MQLVYQIWVTENSDMSMFRIISFMLRLAFLLSIINAAESYFETNNVLYQPMPFESDTRISYYTDIL